MTSEHGIKASELPNYCWRIVEFFELNLWAESQGSRDLHYLRAGVRKRSAAARGSRRGAPRVQLRFWRSATRSASGGRKVLLVTDSKSWYVAEDLLDLRDGPDVAVFSRCGDSHLAC
jgi:hypothetical protein